jgi:NitT/TauT family transport system permease protein
VRLSFFKRGWGDAETAAQRSRWSWSDFLIVIGLAGLLSGLLDLAGAWSARDLPPAIAIDLSPWALPRYAWLSLTRCLLAYVLSLVFTLTFSYWVVKDPVAGHVFLPLTDVFRRTAPVVGFLPPLVLALVAMFPGRRIGLELGAIFMMFMAQTWGLATSFRHALRSAPREQQEMATVFRFSWWQRFKWVELPASTISLVWNSMICMARGWFVLMISETFRLGNEDFRLPGIGAYMSVAVEGGRWDAIVCALAVMAGMIILLDQLLWRPLVVWAQRFRVEEEAGSEEMSSWFLTWLRRSRLLAGAGRIFQGSGVRSQESGVGGQGSGVRSQESDGRKQKEQGAGELAQPRTDDPRPAAQHESWPAWVTWMARVLFLSLMVPLAYGAWQLVVTLQEVPWADWGWLVVAAAGTLGRVVLATALAVLWTVPAGLAIGLSPRMSGIFQPVVQVVTAFPAPLLFPLVGAGLVAAGVPWWWGSGVLMLLASQAYILFNVIGGTMAIPAELKEAVRSFRLSRWGRFRSLYLPAVLPSLLTGWETATGAAWSTSIVAEYMTVHGQVLKTWGLGGAISAAAHDARFSLLAASLVVMCLVMYLVDVFVWRRCHQLVRQRFALVK